MLEFVASSSDSRGPMPMPHNQLPQYLKDRGFAAHDIGGITYITPPLCAVAAGSFPLGSDPAHDLEARLTEYLQQRLTLPAFHIGRYSVTVAEYRCAVRAGAVREPPVG